MDERQMPDLVAELTSETQNVHRPDRPRRGTLHQRHGLSGGSGMHLRSSFGTVVRRVREFSLCADLFASLIDDRVLLVSPGQSCCPLCLGPRLRIPLIILMATFHSEP